ncbi:MAG: hypothetical protein COV74_04275 [Candidatus Omnitrophica bacterium CG11_big_fil_rev_8_21_14_0_20_45_26]|uniref:Uncharacterized protein n=1 Tax=Candidatus Abzuiibacterium crystallinum TaxID=1974748 RepID=A0A2H0LQ95_9BACT|nr:MAG: hypothetical protein COV74_04275 [Candidatus Omnitrophica bacterium CG11_big_fil_rev_8_21_14_0_20_45_26]PIW63972.1 MAG: hypothetical protein COW12_08705 [Candidatus Omnitrophica bacterium CG12_big_fil_rev_8_21_14_0_65_45_16]
MSKIKFIPALLLSLFILTSNAPAFEAGDQTIDLDLGNTYVTKYVFRGVDTFNDQGGMQPYVTLTFHPFDTNMAFGYWGSFALKSGFEDLDEEDFWFSMDKDFGIFNFGWGYTYYDFFNNSSDGDINEFQFYGSISEIPLPEGTDLPLVGNKIPLSLGYKAAYAFGNKSPDKGGIDNGWYQEVNAGIEIPIPGSEKIPYQSEGMALSYNHVFGFYDGQLNFNAGFHYWTQSISTSIALPGNVSITPSLNYQVTDGSSDINPEDEFYFMLDFAVSF